MTAKNFGEIIVDSAERDDPGDCWVVSLRVVFRDIGTHRCTRRISQTIDDKAYPPVKRSMAEATEKARREVAADLFRVARVTADLLPDEARDRFTAAFPQKAPDPELPSHAGAGNDDAQKPAE